MERRTTIEVGYKLLLHLRGRIRLLLGAFGRRMRGRGTKPSFWVSLWFIVGRG